MLETLNHAVTKLKPILPPISKLHHAQDNELLLCCFSLQLMLRTLTAPLQQIHEYHRKPNFNVDSSQLSHAPCQSVLPTKLAQYVMQWLTILESGSSEKLHLLLQQVEHPEDNSKVPNSDDASFLDLADLQVHLCTMTTVKHRLMLAIPAQTHSSACHSHHCHVFAHTPHHHEVAICTEVYRFGLVERLLDWLIRPKAYTWHVFWGGTFQAARASW